MKKFAIILTLLFITTASAHSYEQHYKPNVGLIHGTEDAKEVSCRYGRAYVYDKYIIYTAKSPDFEGKNIFVFDTNGKETDPCTLNPKDSSYFIKAGEFGGANEFTGLLGDMLFLDQWTGRDHKRLLIIDIPKQSLLFFDWYDDPEISNGILSYNKVLKAGKKVVKSIPCPEAKTWIAEGLLPIYIQKAELNLETMKKDIDPARTCKAVAPITGAKKSRYSGH